MSTEELLAELLRLPPDERRKVRDELDVSLGAPEPDPDMTPELRAELERRYQDLLDHPEAGSTWEEVSARLRARKKRAS